MEQLHNLPVPQLEPIQHLGDYLNGLNVCEALESLNQLADQVLVQDQHHDEANNYTTDCTIYEQPQQQNHQFNQFLTIPQEVNCFRFGLDNNNVGEQPQSCNAVSFTNCQPPMSPPSDVDSSLTTSSRCSSAHNSSQWLSSGPNSPASSEFSHHHHLYASSRSSTCSVWSMSSSGPASVASSIGEHSAIDHCSNSSNNNNNNNNSIQDQLMLVGSESSGSSRSSCKSSRSSTSSRSSSSSSVSPSRRLRNATAAERYRRRQKGRKCGLMDELELERERNEQLRREFESKLSLYREFVALLARQTTTTDQELAKLGSKSLTSVLGSISSGSHQNLANETSIQHELRAHLTHFQSLLRAQSGASNNSTCSLKSVRAKACEQQQQQTAAGGEEHPHHRQVEQYCLRPGYYQPAVVAFEAISGISQQQQLQYDFYADRFVPLIGA